MPTFVDTFGLVWPAFTPFVPNTQFITTLILDATGEKVAFMGRFWHPDGGTKAIRKIGFRFGPVTKAGGSALTVSLQDISASGPPTVPDETQDQTVTIANADATFATNTWCLTGNLSADRTINQGDLVAVVFEFDGAGRLGSDSVAIGPANRSGAPFLDAIGHCGQKTGGTWAININPVYGLIFECSDGSFATLNGPEYSFPMASASSSGVSYSSSTVPDERAVHINLPFDCYCDGGYLGFTSAAAATADAAMVLYEGTTARETVNFDANQLYQVQVSANIIGRWTPRLITKNTDWYLSLKPLTTTSISPYVITVAAAGHWDLWPGGQPAYQATRADAGAWTPSLTTRLLGGIFLNQIDIGGAGGGAAMLSRIQGGF